MKKTLLMYNVMWTYIIKCDKIDKDAFCEKLAERIYLVRNQVVHTKKFEWENLFTPTQSNFNDISDGVKLIRVLAYALMNKK